MTGSSIVIIILVLIIIILLILLLLSKISQKETLEQLHFHRSLIDSIPTPIFYKDHNLVFSGCNKAFETFLWKRKDEIVGKKEHDLTTKEIADYHHKKDQELIEFGGEQVYESRLTHADGTEHNIIFHKIISGGITSTGTGIIGTFVDITERKKMEQEIININEEYLLLLDNIPIQVWYLNDTETYGKVNNSHAEFLGKKKEEMENKSIKDIIPKEEADKIIASNHVVFEEKRQVHTEESIYNSYNDRRLLYIIKTPKVDKDGRVRHVVCAAEDITERKMVEEALIKDSIDSERANKAKSMFLANMSHEIRTPLNAIIGFLDLLNATPMSVIQKDYVNTISDSGKVLLTLINDILDFSKIEANQIELESIPFNLEYLTESALRIIRPKVQNRGVFLYYEYDKSLPKTFIGDPTRIRQIILNLLSNADKFTDKGEIQIAIGSTHTDSPSKDGTHEIYISVTDTGIGIPDNKQDKIFLTFTQADSSTTRVYGGSGLGLTICKALVEKMKGRIWVESMENVGSSFQFIIKLEVTASDIDTIKASDLEELKGKEVLIIDSNDYTRIMLEKNCREFGLDVIFTGATGTEGLAFLSQMEDKTPSVLVIADLLMSDIDGFVFAQKIYENPDFNNIKLVAISTSTLPGDAKKAQENGFDAYLPKPVLKYDLIKILQYTIGLEKKSKTLITKHTAKEAEYNKIKVLIAEDNKVNQKLIKAILKGDKYITEIVDNGNKAIALLEKEHFDICLMDLNMPEMDGIEATKIIRERVSKDLPIIALTAAAMQEDKKSAFDAGMNDFATKPVNPQALREKIDHWLKPKPKPKK
ncbi:MAG: response regulator [bacterium]|nr:response regulator [bacterium]